MVAGTLIHLFGGGLLALPLVLLVHVSLTQPSTSRPQGQQQSGIDVDMVITYSLFAFTGMMMTCLAVYLRAGSFYWNFFSILLGVVLAFAADPSIRTKLKKNITRTQESQKTITVLQTQIQNSSQQKALLRPAAKTKAPSDSRKQEQENTGLIQAHLLDMQDQQDALNDSSQNSEDKDRQLAHEIAALRSQCSRLEVEVSEKELTIKSQKESLQASQNTLQQGSMAYEQLQSLNKQYAQELQTLKLRNDQLVVKVQDELISKETQRELTEHADTYKKLAQANEKCFSSALSDRHETATALLAETREKLTTGESAHCSATFRLQEAGNASHGLQLTASQRQLEEATREKESGIAINERMVGRSGCPQQHYSQENTKNQKESPPLVVIYCE